MPDYFGQPTTLSVVLAAIGERIRSRLGYSVAQVVEALDEDLVQASPHAQLFVQLGIRSGVARAGDVAGGGERLTTVDFVVAVNLFRRVSLDLAGRDAQALRSETLGTLAAWRDVTSVLQMYYPPRPVSGGGSPFVEPMRLIRVLFPARVPRNNGWSKVASDWAVTATLDLTPPPAVG